MSGWVKLHRQLLEWEWISDPVVGHLWINLLLRANYKHQKYKGHDVPVGSLVVGRKSLSAQTGLSEQQIRTGLNKLKSSQQITIKTTNKFSIITITCWDKYQDDNQHITNNQPTDNQQITTLKEGKKERRKECNIDQSGFEDFWKRYPKKVGKASVENIYKRKVKKHSHQSIMDGLNRYLDHWEASKTEKQFIPNPSTFLNQERWNDDLPEQKSEFDKFL